MLGDMQTLTLDGETGMNGKEVDDWAMYNQIPMKYKSPRQKAWLVERHNASIRFVLQRVATQVIKESLWVNFNTMFALVTFMHNALVCINQHIPYQALLGRQPNLVPPLEGGY